jgi:hypothetical protein
MKGRRGNKERAPSSENLKRLGRRATLRARFQGPAEVTCPECGYLNRWHVRYLSWRVTCREETCRAIFAIGVQLWKISPGYLGVFSTTPPDMIIPGTAAGKDAREVYDQPLIPAETFPEWPPVPLERLRSGDMINLYLVLAEEE